MSDVAVNTKAGYCTNCRGDQHSLCMSDRCTCPDMRKHRNRPGFAGRGEAPTGTRPLKSVSPTNATPVIELVAEEPPEPPRKLNLLEQVVETVRDGLTTDGRWYRVAVMPTPRTAKALVTKLTKHDLTEQMALEWRAADLKVFVKGPA